MIDYTNNDENNVEDNERLFPDKYQENVIDPRPVTVKDFSKRFAKKNENKYQKRNCS